ncbi:lysophospholipid acyltransferase family protein [Permianibacter aggregans]|uniref:1-acyl-sn-glycerol-3-phosphate acyltransferase n=1 Tax=Permianibacter aggregans TaxID=1510150 RepID=A0A4R6UI11_9GAMM|nr:lysophospholipid acyltransferase family protein [Permianibacter aggregans]QGX40650.1 1-acyl-sn-glycerol-3-phosphate acyltransferase [Permianibacter aggregans]TDQ46520.1 1-acyl-sn-glycerol-3-phosphate acyltransferase [Permianibacter aggregans]
MNLRRTMTRFLTRAFVALIMKPICLWLLGMKVQHRHKLPINGPAIVACTHNSHVDTAALFALFPLRNAPTLRPVAAMDHFFKSPLWRFLSRDVLNLIPIDRSGKTPRERLFDECHAALDAGDILLIFPEGSRGEPEQRSPLKKGLYYLAKERPNVPIIPVCMRGTGKVLPRGDNLIVPFTLDVVIGDPMYITDDSDEFIALLDKVFDALDRQCVTARPVSFPKVEQDVQDDIC